jgi:hypothetical protein
MSQEYEIDEETMEICNALAYYDENRHFPWEKKKVIITLRYDNLDKLKGKNRSKFIEELITTTTIN